MKTKSFVLTYFVTFLGGSCKFRKFSTKNSIEAQADKKKQQFESETEAILPYSCLSNHCVLHGDISWIMCCV